MRALKARGPDINTLWVSSDLVFQATHSRSTLQVRRVADRPSFLWELSSSVDRRGASVCSCQSHRASCGGCCLPRAAPEGPCQAASSGSRRCWKLTEDEQGREGVERPPSAPLAAPPSPGLTSDLLGLLGSSLAVPGVGSAQAEWTRKQTGVGLGGRQVETRGWRRCS